MRSPKQILVPMDFSPYSDQALDYAVTLARQLGATIHVVNAIGVPALGAPEIGMTYISRMVEEATVSNQASLDKLVAKYQNGGLTFGQVLVRTGDARDVILQTAEQVNADLIVMGTHGRRGISRALLGSVAEMVVRNAQVPVLTVRGHK